MGRVAAVVTRAARATRSALMGLRTAWSSGDFARADEPQRPFDDLWGTPPKPAPEHFPAQSPRQLSLDALWGEPPVNSDAELVAVTEAAADDWLWDASPAMKATPPSPVELVDLPDYSPEGSRPLFVAPSARPTRDALWLAKEIAAMLDVRRAAELKTVEGRLAAVLTGHDPRATALRMKALVEDGATADTLLAAAGLKSAWAERPEFWLSRRLTGITQHADGAGMLSWRAAHVVASARWACWPEEMIDPDWLTDWRRLSLRDAGYGWFPRYVELRATEDAFEDDEVWDGEEAALWRERGRADGLRRWAERRQLVGVS